MTTLTSPSNPKIKHIRLLLQQRKARQASGLFVAEGIRHVGEACAAGAALEYICYAPGLLSSEFARQLIQQQETASVPCYAVAEEVFAGLAEKDNPPGLLAVIRQPRRTLADLDPQRCPWLVALVAPQDPGNIGSILRCAEAVGAHGLLLLDDPAHNQHSADPYHPGAVRASMGALFWLPLVQVTFAEFAPWAAGQGYHIYGSSAHASQPYDQVESYAPRRVLLLGSERQGLFPHQAAACQTMLRMPMLGRVTSLNLAVAAGVLLYKMLEKQKDVQK